MRNMQELHDAIAAHRRSASESERLACLIMASTVCALAAVVIAAFAMLWLSIPSTGGF